MKSVPSPRLELVGMRLQREEAGSAAVELALLAPLLVALLGMIVFLGDLGTARIRQRSVVRLAAWELTAHPLSDERRLQHATRWETARASSAAEVERLFGGGVSTGLLAGGVVEDVQWEPLAVDGGGRLERPPIPAGAGILLENLGSLLQKAGGLQLPLLEKWGFNVKHAGVQVEARVAVRGTALLPDLPSLVELRPARLALQIDPWALDDGADVPLPGEGTDFGRQVGRIALFGLGEKLRSGGAGAVLDWLPLNLAAPVVSMNYGPPEQDRSPVSCGGDDALARTGRWENGPRVGTRRDTLSPVRCFDTLPIDANGFGRGGGRKADPLWRQLRARGPWQMGCNRPGASWPAGCGGQAWAGASSP